MPSAFLVYRRVRHVQPGRWAEGLWCWPLVQLWRAAVLPWRKSRAQAIWTWEDLSSEVPNHHLPASLLCSQQLWGSQGSNDVNFLLILVCIGCNLQFYDFSKFAQTVPRPFGVRYNPYTQSVEILDSKTQIESLMTCTSQDMQVLIEALKKI